MRDTNFCNRQYVILKVLWMFTAWQDDDSGASSTISKHLAQALFLVRSEHGCGLQVDVNVRVHRVVTEVVLG